MSTNHQPDIFISHSSKDDHEVDRIAEALRAVGMSVWVDHQNGIPIGAASFDQIIQENLNSCQRGLLILTADSAKSYECNGEWRHILTAQKPLYTAKLKDFPQSDFPSRLAIMQYANLVGDYQEGLTALIQALKEDKPLDINHPGTAIALRTSGRFPNNQLSLPIIGRDNDLKELSLLLTQPRATILTGPGGIGKTRLAAELAARAANPDGVVWFTLAHAPTLEQAEVDVNRLTALLKEHLGLAQSTSPDAVWNKLGGSQTLLVLDNAESCQHPQPFVDHINQLNQGNTGLGVLITSRYTWPELDPSTPYSLMGLKAPEAKLILANMIEAKLPPNRPHPTEAEINTLASAAHYHPRILEFTATWLKGYPVEKVEEWLRTLKGDKPESMMVEVIGRTLSLLSEQRNGQLAIAALHRLLACKGGFTYEAAEALLMNLSGAIDTLDILVAWNLLYYDGNRYDIDLLTRETQAPDAAGHLLHYDYYVTLFDKRNIVQEYTFLFSEAGNIEAAFEWAMSIGEVEKAFWAANVATHVFYNQGRFTQLLTWLQRVEAALPLAAESVLRGKLYNDLGIAYSRQPAGNRRANLSLAKEAFSRALQLRTREYYSHEYAQTQLNIGNSYLQLAKEGESREANLTLAISTYQDALTISTISASSIRYALLQNNLADAYRQLAELNNKECNALRAVAACRRALRFRTKEEYQFDYAMTNHNLGAAYLCLGEVDLDKGEIQESLIMKKKSRYLKLAIEAFEESLQIRTEVAYPLGYATTKFNIGWSYQNFAYATGQVKYLTLAYEANEDAYRASATQTDLSLHLKILKMLINMSYANDNLPVSISYMQEARDIYYKIGKTSSADRMNSQIQNAEQELLKGFE